MARRLICFLLMLCFGSFSAEVAIADVHDGDAPSASAENPTSDQAPAPEDGPPRNGHDVVHVCHCVHAHSSLDPVTAELPVAYPDARGNVDLDVLRPASADLDPHLRPPIE